MCIRNSIWKKIIAFTLLIAGSLQAQTMAPPAIEWQQSFAVSDDDWLVGLLQDSDGGYVLAGAPCYRTNYSFWVMRLDQKGNKIWQKTFGDSTGSKLTDLQPAHDGGWILGGVSSAPAGSPDKTSQLIGERDLWMIHIDADGNKVWDRTYGRPGYNLMGLCFQQTSDHGYILAGGLYIDYEPCDAWIVRLDAAGNEVWNTVLGGDEDDGFQTILQTSDGGFLLGGGSRSSPGVSKTSPAFGRGDYWVVRLDSSGAKIWDSSFGGSSDEWFSSLCSTPDGGFVAAGTSFSGISGNKTNDYYGGDIFGDFWLVRGNSNGTMVWNKSFGASHDELLRGIEATADGGVVMCGLSGSGMGGNKTSTNFSLWSDGWVVRLDRNGDKLWEQCYGGTNGEQLNSIKQTADGGYILAGVTGSDVSGNKTTPLLGKIDVWVLKLAPDALSAPPQIRLQSQPPEQFQTNGSRFFLSGVSNQLYRIEYSTDLQTWNSLQTNRASAFELELIDPAATNDLRRFYRAKPIPE